MNQSSTFQIVPVRTKEDLNSIRNLFRTYVEWLNIDLSFQDFENELAQLPGKYAPPTGELLLAKSDQQQAIGCVAVRCLGPLDSKCCEMKRLYTLPTVRGKGIGRALVNSIIDVARSLGYKQMKLDTLPTMEIALNLYRSVGFSETESYYETPIQETVFLCCSLDNN